MPRMLTVWVKPNAKASLLEQNADGEWIARLKAPPVDGQANRELIALLARHFQCPKSAITIQTGLTSRRKRVRIE